MHIQGFTPAINAPLQAQASSTSGTSANGTSSSSGDNGLSSNNLQSTFLNLLVTELQNQDPTQPVDPTEMVGQMVSLNELDQLISINQTLTSMSGAAGSTGTSGTGTQGSVASNPIGGATTSAEKASSLPTVFGSQPATMSAPVPGGLMNLYGNIGAQTTNSNHATQGGR